MQEYFILPKIDTGTNWQSFAIICRNEKMTVFIRKVLSQMGIESNQGAYALSTQSAYSSLPTSGSLEVSQYLFKNTIVLPLHSRLSDTDTGFIMNNTINAVNEFLE